MKPERQILEILFPKVRAEILRLLFTSPRKERYVRELVRMSGLALCTVQDELRKLSAVQLVTSRSNRYHRFYRANHDHPLFSELLRVVEKSARLPRTKPAGLHRKSRSRKPRRRSAAAPPRVRETEDYPRRAAVSGRESGTCLHTGRSTRLLKAVESHLWSCP